MSRLSRQPPLRPRKTPTQERATQTVDSIIEAAAQVLEIEGLEGFNTNAIARRAGVSIGSLYQYFPGRDALMAALVAREAQRLYDDAAAALDMRSGKAALEHLIGVSVRQQVRRPTLARLLDIEEGRPALNEVANPQKSQRLIAAVIRRAKPAPAQVEEAAADVLAIIRGMIDAAGERGERDSEAIERRVRAAVFGYLRGMSRQAPARTAGAECEQSPNTNSRA